MIILLIQKQMLLKYGNQDGANSTLEYLQVMQLEKANAPFSQKSGRQYIGSSTIYW